MTRNEWCADHHGLIVHSSIDVTRPVRLRVNPTGEDRIVPAPRHEADGPYEVRLVVNVRDTAQAHAVLEALRQTLAKMPA